MCAVYYGEGSPLYLLGALCSGLALTWLGSLSTPTHKHKDSHFASCIRELMHLFTAASLFRCAREGHEGQRGAAGRRERIILNRAGNQRTVCRAPGDRDPPVYRRRNWLAGFRISGALQTNRTLQSGVNWVVQPRFSESSAARVICISEAGRRRAVAKRNVAKRARAQEAAPCEAERDEVTHATVAAR